MLLEAPRPPGPRPRRRSPRLAHRRARRPACAPGPRRGPPAAAHRRRASREGGSPSAPIPCAPAGRRLSGGEQQRAGLRGSSAFWATVRYGIRFLVVPCHKKPTVVLRYADSPAASSWDRSVPPTDTRPAVTVSTPPIRFKMVDLPAPLGPTIAAYSPRAISSETPPSAATPTSPTRWTL